MKEVKTDPKILLIGVGNYDWGDDSLGWSFVDKEVSQGYDFLDYQYRYKLKTEDAELLAKYDMIVFVTASRQKLTSGFKFEACIAAGHSFYSEQAHAPAAILHLTNELYNKCPKAYLLSISGTVWDMQPYLSSEGNKNLESAIEFFEEQFLHSVLGVSV